jgi:uncharacterized protein YceH (UPF0502 family)
MLDLDASEVRVLGCLMEKQVTTPDIYPLTLNSLLAACNQTTNRFPVVRYGEGEVNGALQSLRERGLTRVVHSTSNRATKYRHVADEVLRLDSPEQALVCVLLLRGPQTVGELKGRTERQHPFADLTDVEACLDGLAARDEPLVLRLPRQPGQKDARWAHLLGGPVDVSAAPEHAVEPAAVPRGDRLAELERRVADLEQQLEELRTTVQRLAPLLD